MHVYIYDAKLNLPKYQHLLAKIETRLTDLGLNGKIVRLSPMHNLKKTLIDEAKPARTIVFVGTDYLLSEGLSVLLEKDITIGYIPTQEKQPLAMALGIPTSLEACDLVAARRLIKLDVGLANNQAFLGELELPSSHVLIDINNKISIEVSSQNLIRVINLPLTETLAIQCSPQDGLLDLTITTKNRARLFKSVAGLSHFRNSTFTINSDFPALLDKQIKIDSPVKIGIIKNAISFIVGRERIF